MSEPTLKREAPSCEEEVEAKKLKVEAEPSTVAASSADEVAPAGCDLAKLQRQIEYYFSDNNLKYDAFFHPIISNDPEGWLPMSNILSCKRIQSLGATVENIKAALADSHLKFRDATETLEAAVRRDAPLPSLEQRPERPQRPNRTETFRRGDDFHAAGCIIRIDNLPEEASWETIKLKLNEKFPDRPGRELTEDEVNAGKKSYIERGIQFVSMPNSKAQCYALMGVFEGDREAFKTVGALDINGVECAVSLVTDAGEALEFCKTLPGMIAKRREREISRRRKEVNQRPVMLNGFEFKSIDHLRQCIREVLNQADVGKSVNAKTSKVLRGLLEYHPNGSKKLQDAVDFKVDLIKKGDDSAKPTRCFFVVKSDGSSDDISIQKCFAGLAQRAPLMDKKPKEESPAEPALEAQPQADAEQTQTEDAVVEETKTEETQSEQAEETKTEA